MRSSKKPLGIFSIIILSVFPLIGALEVLDCSIPEITIQLDGLIVNVTNLNIAFKYKRNSLEVYQYPGTPSVNLFISDSQISFAGKVDNDDKGLSGTKEYQSQIIGIANIADSSNYTKGLKDCTFFTTDKENRFYDELPDVAQSEIFRVVEGCLSSKLCEKLDGVRTSDILKAQQNSRDFGPLSIWDGLLIFAYPKLKLPSDPKDVKMYPVGRESKLVKAAESIIVGTRQNLHGSIRVPDIKRGLMSARNGSFSFVHEMYITDDIIMRASPSSGISQRFSFGFKIFETFLNYEEFKAINILPLKTKLCVALENITFSTTVEMDFSGSYCRPSVKKFKIENPGTPKTEICGQNDIRVVNSILEWFISNWYREGLAALAKHIEIVLATHVLQHFDCEKFRRGARTEN